jgi:ATP-dependent DNA helicase RecQ
MAVLNVLKAAHAPTPKSSLAELTGFPARRVTGLLNQLEEAGAVTMGKRGVRLDSKAKLPALVDRAVELAEARQRVEQSRLTMMRAYAETDGCRRQFLLGYFGEDLPEPCGNCDGCTAAAGRQEAAEAAHDGGGPDRKAQAGKKDAAKKKGPWGKKAQAAKKPGAKKHADDPFPLQSTVVHKDWGPGLVMRHEDDVITVLFEQEGYKTLSRSAVVKHELLKPA